MKHLIRIIIALAAIFATFCAFLAVMEHISSRMSFTTEETPSDSKIQFDMDEMDENDMFI